MNVRHGALAVLAGCLLLLSGATGAANEEGKTKSQIYLYSDGDFIAHGSDRRRAPEVDAKPFRIPASAGFMLSERNANEYSSFQSPTRLVDRLTLVVGPGHEVWSGADLMSRLIASGTIEKYPDIRSDAGLARYASDTGGLLVVYWEDGEVRGAGWFEIRVHDAVTGAMVFKARNTVRNSVSWRRWNGISDNEYVNPVFNAFIDWYRANSGVSA